MKKDWMVKESELDSIQIQFLTSILDKSYILRGCAGSGKSVLALIKAQRIQRERGDNYKIIVFTKALCKYMNCGREELGLRNNFFYYKEWRWKKVPKLYRDGRTFMVYQKDEKGNNVPHMPHADYFIVDEIQDFTKTEIEEFIASTNKFFYFIGDTAQSIYTQYKKTMPVEEICGLFQENGSPKLFTLYYNYRLPLPIARYVQHVGVDLPPFDEKIYKSREKEKPYVLKYESANEQILAIQRIISEKDLSDVAILFPMKTQVLLWGNVLRRKGMNVEIQYDDQRNNLNFSTSNPKVMTYHSAKGLQFETVFLPFVEFSYNDGNDRRKSLYTAMTRTYKKLYIMYSRALPIFLSRISRNLYETSEVNDFKDID